MTVIDNVIVGALIRTTIMREARAKAHEVLEFCGLAARADVRRANSFRRKSAASKSHVRLRPNRSCCCSTKSSPG